MSLENIFSAVVLVAVTFLPDTPLNFNTPLNLEVQV